jgi:hypothetical protein
MSNNGECITLGKVVQIDDARIHNHLARQADADAEQRHGMSLRHTSMKSRLVKIIEAMPAEERKHVVPQHYGKGGGEATSKRASTAYKEADAAV